MSDGQRHRVCDALEDSALRVEPQLRSTRAPPERFRSSTSLVTLHSSERRSTVVRLIRHGHHLQRSHAAIGQRPGDRLRWAKADQSRADRREDRDAVLVDVGGVGVDERHGARTAGGFVDVCDERPHAYDVGIEILVAHDLRARELVGENSATAGVRFSAASASASRRACSLAGITIGGRVGNSFEAGSYMSLTQIDVRR